MSVINEALQRASNEQKDKNVIPVPRAVAATPWSLYVMAAALLMAVAFLGFRLYREHEARLAAESALSARFEDLSQRHADLISRIYQSDAHLDTRLQLEVFDLKADLRKLSARMDELNVDELKELKTGSALMRDEVKEELHLLSKRFHNNEREHSILNDRIEALKARLDGNS